MNKAGPFFSIVTCTLNSSKYLPDNLASVEAQNFDRFEHIFIDGNSTDDSPKLIQGYKHRMGDKVRVYRLNPDGVSKAMNEGIKKARGEVILHLHSDDQLYDPHVLSLVYKLFQANSRTKGIIGDCQFIGSKQVQVFPKGRFGRFLLHHFLSTFLWGQNVVPHPSTYIKKSLFKQYGKFDARLKAVMDYEYWLRISQKEQLFLTYSKLSKYRVHENTISNRLEETANKEVELIKNKYRKQYWKERTMLPILEIMQLVIML